MQRRKFIKVLGSAGVITTLPGCFARMPAEAVAPWSGPHAQADVRRRALGYAILAPTSHNRQPWLADLREPSAITLFVDRERLLPETDPWFRQIVVSQGTFIESLVIAMREHGIDPHVDLFPQGAFPARTLDDRPVARISWNPAAPPPPKDPLFAQLLRRHTAKVDYDTARPVHAPTLAALAQSQQDPLVRFDATVDASRVRALRELCWQSARAELLTPRTVMESIRLTRVGPAEIARHRDGIALNGTAVRFLEAVGAFDRTQPPAHGSSAEKHMLSRFEGHSRSAMGFVWLSTDSTRHAAQNTTRHAEVQAGRAYMRLQLKATELGLQMHPMSQAAQEFAEMKPHLDAMHRLLVGRPAQEETVQMFCRVGYCADQEHTPRRGVDAIIRA